MKSKWLKLGIAAVLALTLAMTACGKGGESSSAESSAESQTESESEAESSSVESSEESQEESSSGEVSSEAESTKESDSTEESGTHEHVDFSSDEVTLDNVDDYLTLGEYKNFTLVRDTSYESEDDTSPAIMKELYDLYYTYPADTKIENGMTADISYVGRADGVAFDGGTGRTNLVIGSGNFIPGFEDQLIGHTAGENVVLNVTFPDDYWDEEMAGVEAEFTVDIHHIIDDPWKLVTENSELKKKPEELINVWVHYYEHQFEDAAKYYEVSVDEYKEAVGITDTTEELAEGEAKNYITSLAVCKAEGITKDSDTFKEMEEAIISSSGYENRDAVLADGITELQMDVRTFYYCAYHAILQNAKEVTEESFLE